MFSLTLWPGVALGGGREDGRSSPVPFHGDLAGPPDCGPVSGGHTLLAAMAHTVMATVSV